MRGAKHREFKAITPGVLAVFVVILVVGAVALVLSLLYILDSLPAAAPAEALQRWAATTGVGVGVMLLAAVMALLLGLVTNLSREVARLKEQGGAGAGEVKPQVRSTDTDQRPAEPGAAPDRRGI